MIERTIKEKLLSLAKKFPVITLTGVRQSGKSTLLKNCFPECKYVSLEDPDIRVVAQGDPRGFLQNYGYPLIIDEVQNVPQLFSYIQTIVDEKDEVGMYFLSGSQNFLLMESVSQSLAGRAAVLKMTPFSTSELKQAGLLGVNLNEYLYTGGYPRIYDRQIKPVDYFPSYIQTYIERDARQLRNIGNHTQFNKFLRLCAGRAGQLLNISSLATEAELSIQTVNAWLSVLETSNVVFQLHPYHKNFNKRLVKSSKLYFYDTGLLCSLLGLQSAEQLEIHYLRGEIFENMIVAECMKRYLVNGFEPQLYFWRDSNGNEVDLLAEEGTKLYAYEIKSAATLRLDFFKNLKLFEQVSEGMVTKSAVVYGGATDFSVEQGSFISWQNW